jgi:OOP family OmpA-OmpF porin
MIRPEPRRGVRAVRRSLLLALAALPLATRAAFTADAAEPPPAVAAAPITDRDPGPFPFLPALEGYEPAPADTSSWTKSTDFARYGFQAGADQYAEVGGRLEMRHFTTSAPGTSSVDKVVESYRQIVEEKGGVMLYSGLFSGGVVDANPRSEQQAREGATYLVRTPERELWAQVSIRDEGDEYVLVVVEKGPLVLKTKPLTSSELARSLDETGKAILYVNFEFDRADLRPDAKPVIDQVYELLKSNPSLKLAVVGHTDDRGPAAYNQSLSERRAAAVRAALLSRGLGADGDARLTASGKGAAEPIADNATDEGRAKNRRVELVKQ